MGAAAQVDEAVAVAVDAHLAVARDLARLDVLDDLALVGVVGEQRQPFVGGELVALEGLVLGDDLAHAGLDALEVVVGERLAVGQVEVVVEAVLDGRADGERGPRVEAEHGLGEQVGGGVAERRQAPLGVGGDDLDRGAVGQGSGEVALVAVDDRDEGVLGQALADVGGQIGPGGALGQRSARSVGQRHGDVGHGRSS